MTSSTPRDDHPVGSEDPDRAQSPSLTSVSAGFSRLSQSNRSYPLRESTISDAIDRPWFLMHLSYHLHKDETNRKSQAFAKEHAAISQVSNLPRSEATTLPLAEMRASRSVGDVDKFIEIIREK